MGAEYSSVASTSQAVCSIKLADVANADALSESSIATSEVVAALY